MFALICLEGNIGCIKLVVWWTLDSSQWLNSYKKEHLISIHTYNLIGKLKFLGLFWRNVLKEGEKERLVENIGNDLSKAQKFLQVKIVPIAQSNFNIDGDKRTNDGCFWRTNEMIDAIGTSYNFGKP